MDMPTNGVVEFKGFGAHLEEMRRKKVEDNRKKHADYCRRRYQEDDDYRKKQRNRQNKRYQQNEWVRRKSRAWYIQKKYKISDKEKADLYAAQGGKCAICGKPKQLYGDMSKVLCIDHSEKSGKVRGLLCTNCNLGIGHFKDDVRAMENAIVYLKSHDN